MKYMVSIDLDLPREKVVALYTDPSNLVKWQRGLQGVTLTSGEAGQPGATSDILFQMGKRKMEMVETILEKDLPDHVAVAYDAKGVHNRVWIRFVETGPKATRLESENEFLFSGFMKVIGVLAKGAFPRQTSKYLKDFKAFAEDGTDVREA